MYEAVGYISAVCFSMCYIPQLWKTWRTKSVEDISVWMWILQGGAHTSGLVYGMHLESLPLVLNYTLGAFYTFMWLNMYWVYRDPDKAYVRKIIREIINETKKKNKGKG